MKQWNYEIKNNPKDISEKLESALRPNVYQKPLLLSCDQQKP